MADDHAISRALRTPLTRRQVLSGGVTAGTAAFLAACGGAASTPAPTAAPTAAPTTAPTAAPPTAAPTAAPEDWTGIKLRVASTGTTTPPAKEAGEVWAARTKGEVSAEPIPFAERAIKYASFIAAQDPTFDVLYGGYTYIRQFADRLYEDLTPYDIDTSDFIPATLPELSYPEGHLLAVPIHSEQEIFLFNRTMFEAAGIDPENPPKTWDEMYSYAPKLKEGKPAGFTVCAVPWLASFAEIWFCVYFNSTEGTWLSEDRTQFLGGDDNGLEAWRAIKRGFDAGFYDLAGATLPGDYDTGLVFNQGLAACQINVAELWAQATSGKGVKPEFKVNIEPQEVGAVINPGIKAGTSGGGAAYEGFGLNRFGRQKEAGISFIREVSGAEYQKKMVFSVGLPPSRVSVINDPEVIAKYPVGQVLAEQGKYRTSRYLAPYNWSPVVTGAMNKMINGEWTAEQAHEETIKGMEDVIVKYLTGA